MGQLKSFSDFYGKFHPKDPEHDVVHAVKANYKCRLQLFE